MSNLGTLSLPQLHSRGNPVIIRDITRKDAEGLIQNLAERTKTARKLKNYPAAIEDAFFEVNAVGSETFFESDDEDALIELLSESEIPGLRGERAVFFESENFLNGEPSAFLIGTTVIYNKNWATLGVLDLGVVELIDDETYEETAKQSSDDEDEDYEDYDDEYYEEDEEEDESDGSCEICGEYH